MLMNALALVGLLIGLMTILFSPPHSPYGLQWTPYGLYPKYSLGHISRWSPLHLYSVQSTPVQSTPVLVIYHSTAFFELSLKILSNITDTDYSDVIYHSAAFFKLSLNMLSNITDYSDVYSDVICYSTLFFKLSLKYDLLHIIVLFYFILQFFWSWVWKYLLWAIRNLYLLICLCNVTLSDCIQPIYLPAVHKCIDCNKSHSTHYQTGP